MAAIGTKLHLLIDNVMKQQPIETNKENGYLSADFLHGPFPPNLIEFTRKQDDPSRNVMKQQPE